MASDPQRRQVELDPSSGSSYPAGAPPSPPRRPLPRWTPTAAFVVVVALIGATVALSGGTGDGTAPTDGLSFDLDGDTTDAAFGGPRDGLDSRRLPVTVTPTDALVDGQTVTVSGVGFPPLRALGVVMCSPLGPSAEGGVANCQISPYTAVTSDSEGSFTVEHVVRRWITLGNGVHDCAGPPPEGAEATCVVAVGAIDDYDQSGIAAVAFDPDAPGRPPLSVVVEPLHPLVEGDELTVTIDNAEPFSSWWIDICASAEAGEVDEWGHAAVTTVCAWGDPEEFGCVGETCSAPVPSGLELVADEAGRITVTLAAPTWVGDGDLGLDCRRAGTWCNLAVRDGAGTYWNWYALEVVGAASPTDLPTETTVPTDLPTETTVLTETTMLTETTVLGAP